MASVSVTINGKNYRMACEEGQEAHLISLGEKLDGFVTQLRGSFGEIGDQRLTVMAGVMVTDELVEMQKKNAALELELKALRDKAQTTVGQFQNSEAEAAAKISELANRIGALASKLSVGSKSAK